MRKSPKYLITEKVLQQLPYEIQIVDAVIPKWWFSMRGEGLRLTKEGNDKFIEAKLEHYETEITIPHYSWYRFITECSNKIKCPYFLGVKTEEGKRAKSYIRLYDSKIAMMLNLYGSIEEYLESVKVRQ